MRVWIAILFSVLVAGMQPALMANDLVTKAQPSCCGKCASACCQSKDASETESTPVAATSSVSQDNFQLISLLVTHLSASLKETSLRAALPSASFVPARSVLIFQRDCTYLI